MSGPKTAQRWQRTLQRAVELTGVGLHSGKDVGIRLAPPAAAVSCSAHRKHGDGAISFRRRGREPIFADATALDPSKSMLCTQLRARDDSWRVSTVEHLMAALVAARVTDVDVDIIEPKPLDCVVELPILDGSALPFVRAIQEAGVRILENQMPARWLRVQRPVQVMMQDKAAWFLPMPTGIPHVDSPTLHMSVQVNFAHKGLGARVFQFSLTGDADANLRAFEEQVAPARTFTFEDEIAWMQANDLALGGSLGNAIVFAQQKQDETSAWRVLNPEGLRFPEDEWVRHKMLDCIGDLGLVGMPVHGYFFSTSPGHALTHCLIEELFADPANYTIEQAIEE
jgi:UDP-3-O-[3-hydroxymyristoyl] N-acetylglucosamine deacetylase